MNFWEDKQKQNKDQKADNELMADFADGEQTRAGLHLTSFFLL